MAKLSIKGGLAVATHKAKPGSMAYGSESLGVAIETGMIVTQKGIHQARNTVVAKFGIGDAGADYIYQRSYGGSINSDDEGVTGRATYITEGNGDGGVCPQALIVSKGTARDGTQLLNLNPTQLPGEFGAGRYALLVTAADGVTDAAIGTFTAIAQQVVPSPGWAAISRSSRWARAVRSTACRTPVSTSFRPMPHPGSTMELWRPRAACTSLG
jgi:hypothetical protein